MFILNLCLLCFLKKKGYINNFSNLCSVVTTFFLVNGNNCSNKLNSIAVVVISLLRKRRHSYVIIRFASSRSFWFTFFYANMPIKVPVTKKQLSSESDKKVEMNTLGKSPCKLRDHVTPKSVAPTKKYKLEYTGNELSKIHQKQRVSTAHRIKTSVLCP